eukprot:jgi/Chlat1/8110/Chrsp75S07566
MGAKQSAAHGGAAAAAAAASRPAHHLPDGGFVNPWPSFTPHQSGLVTFLKLRFQEWDTKRSEATKEVVDALPVKPPDWERIAAPPEGHVQATWIGHASFLLQFDGVTILTDPIWSDRCFRSQAIGPKRQAQIVPPAFPLAKLPPIDVVIISHNHYDHLDENTIKALGNRPLYLVPLGVKEWMEKFGVTNVKELDWWESHEAKTLSGPTLKAVCTPCQHFSGRWLDDRNKTLWSSWVLEGPTKKVYFAGDTGYRSVPKDFQGVETDITPVCPAFAEIGAKHGPFDLALIPIGAYSPRWFMSPVHCSPEDAVALHLAVKSKQSIGMHWGTFVLTDEPILEPPKRLIQELKRLSIDPSSFITLQHGETQSFPTA